MENPTHNVREKIKLIKSKKQIKSKTVMSWSSLKKKEGICCTICLKEILCFILCWFFFCVCVEGKFVFYLMYSGLNTLSGYIHTASYTLFCLF